jgi:hypothetical protein
MSDGIVPPTDDGLALPLTDVPLPDTRGPLLGGGVRLLLPDGWPEQEVLGVAWRPRRSGTVVATVVEVVELVEVVEVVEAVEVVVVAVGALVVVVVVEGTVVVVMVDVVVGWLEQDGSLEAGGDGLGADGGSAVVVVLVSMGEWLLLLAAG